MSLKNIYLIAKEFDLIAKRVRFCIEGVNTLIERVRFCVGESKSLSRELNHMSKERIPDSERVRPDSEKELYFVSKERIPLLGRVSSYVLCRKGWVLYRKVKFCVSAYERRFAYIALNHISRDLDLIAKKLNFAWVCMSENLRM